MASNRSGSTMGCSSEATFSEQEGIYDSRVCKLQFIIYHGIISFLPLSLRLAPFCKGAGKRI